MRNKRNQNRWTKLNMRFHRPGIMEVPFAKFKSTFDYHLSMRPEHAHIANDIMPNNCGLH